MQGIGIHLNKKMRTTSTSKQFYRLCLTINSMTKDRQFMQEVELTMKELKRLKKIINIEIKNRR